MPPKRGPDTEAVGAVDPKRPRPQQSAPAMDPAAIAAMVKQKAQELAAKMAAITAKTQAAAASAASSASSLTTSRNPPGIPARPSLSAAARSTGQTQPAASAAFNFDEVKRKMEAAKESLQNSAAAAGFPYTRSVPSAPGGQASDDRGKRGLKVDVHPLFNASGSADITSILQMIPKGDFATTKANKNRLAAAAASTSSKAGLKPADKAAMAAAAALAAIEREARGTPEPEEKKKKELEMVQPPAEFFDPTKNKYFDPHISARASMPKQRVAGRAFRFVQKGRFVEQANRLRQEAQLEKLKADIAATVKRAGMDVELDLVSDLSVRTIPPPAVEWWDLPLVGPDGTYDIFDFESEIADEHITNLVQHPVPIQPPAELGPPPPKPLMLTKRERKKLRRQRRLEAQREKQAKIRLGLLPPEQPKVKISNLMRVLGTEAVQDPTRVEAAVRAQARARQLKHERHNAENKLTKEQRRERTRLRLLENTHVVVQSAVFRVRDLSRPQHRFKVDINATQLQLTGVVLEHAGCNLVVVEGGNKGVNRYKKLMLRRIDWSEASAAGDDGAVAAATAAGPLEKKPNSCVVVWEGKIKRRLFQGFRVHMCPLERDIKEILEKVGAVHYWDAAKHYVADS